MAAIVNGHTPEVTVKSLFADLNAAEERSDGSSLNEWSRHKLISSLTEAAEDLETPFDAVWRMIDVGRQTAIVVIGADLDIFKSLSQSSTPLSAEQLAKPKGADPILVERLLRYMAASRLIVQTGPDSWTANKRTRAWADPRWEMPVRFFHDVSGPANQMLPNFLKKTGYKNTPPSSSFNMAFNTDMEMYPWLKSNPQTLENFIMAMSMPRENNGVNVLPLETSMTDSHEGYIFVDVGGNHGEQALGVLERSPGLKDRVIVQDRGEVIKRAPVLEGVKWMEHDFFNEQPLKGAKYYYMRQVLHNWSNEDVVKILKNIVPAMSADSLVAIDEVVIPDEGGHVWPTGLDLQMFSLFSTSERTTTQWDALLNEAGLKAVAVKRYAPVGSSCVLLAARK